MLVNLLFLWSNTSLTPGKPCSI